MEKGKESVNRQENTPYPAKSAEYGVFLRCPILSDRYPNRNFFKLLSYEHLSQERGFFILARQPVSPAFLQDLSPRQRKKLFKKLLENHFNWDYDLYGHRCTLPIGVMILKFYICATAETIFPAPVLSMGKIGRAHV